MLGIASNQHFLETTNYCGSFEHNLYNFCWIPRENLAREMCCELVTWSVLDICCPKYVFLTGFGLLGVIVTYSYPKSNIYKTMEQDVRVQIDYSLDLCGVWFSFTIMYTEKFYFAHKRSYSPENFAQKCRKLLESNQVVWVQFSWWPSDSVNKFIIINLSLSILSTVGRLA